MKRINFFVLALTVATFTTSAQQSGASQPSINCDPATHYSVKDRDVLITVNSEHVAADDLRRLVQYNPQAGETGRFRVGPNANGPFETVDVYDLATRLDAGDAPYIIYKWRAGECYDKRGLAGFQIGTNPLVVTTPSPAPSPTPNPLPVAIVTMPFYLQWWFWLLVLAALAFLAWLLFRRYTRPETAGPAYVPGGLTDATAPNALRDQLAQDFGIAPELVQVESVTAGTGRGWARIPYRDGNSEPQFLRDRPCYEVKYRTPNMAADAEPLTGHTLWGCANPVRAGRPDLLPGQDFRFTPYSVNAQVPLPTEWAAPVVATEPIVDPTDPTPTPEPATPVAEPAAEAQSATFLQAIATQLVEQRMRRISIHLDGNDATVADAHGHELKVENGALANMSRMGDAIVFTQGDYKLTVTPTGVRMPEAEPVSSNVNPLGERQTKELGVGKLLGGS